MSTFSKYMQFYFSIKIPPKSHIFAGIEHKMTELELLSYSHLKAIDSADLMKRKTKSKFSENNQVTLHALFSSNSFLNNYNIIKSQYSYFRFVIKYKKYKKY